ncbi:hypothetical protein RvY_01082-2 [Ramazzottius varieornatus]|uniref:Uncharacterized protein n=1 Tax=Ramazzottius varieornatus TaxID=947166 RepID=A0A1D1UL50_RAMVA|nr:hypothetical protein RvY_01082-2 [Ramazzottius varieornatus]
MTSGVTSTRQILLRIRKLTQAGPPNRRARAITDRTKLYGSTAGSSYRKPNAEKQPEVAVSSEESFPLLENERMFGPDESKLFVLRKFRPHAVVFISYDCAFCKLAYRSSARYPPLTT